MGKRSIILAVSAVLIVSISILLAWPAAVPDPVYQGKPLSYWIKGGYIWLHSGNMPSLTHPPDRVIEFQVPKSKVVVRFPAVDTNAVPFLIHTLNRSNWLAQRIYLKAWTVAPAWLRTRVTEPANPLQLRTVSAGLVAQFGPAARPAVPGLVRLLAADDYMAPATAAYALGEIGDDSPKVLKALQAVYADTKLDVIARANARQALEKLHVPVPADGSTR